MNRFTEVPKADIQRSSFDRSHGHKTTINEGYLYPIFLDEALPGDTFNLKMHAIARLSTPIFPIMDNIYIDTQFFAVPYRLLWNNWERFNGAQDNPNDPTDFVLPALAGGLTAVGDLADYFGLPINSNVGLPAGTISALPFRAYALIWNEWYRDQNLQQSIVFDKGDGPDLLSNYPLKKRGKRADYFTTGLPWPQKGPSAEVHITGAGSTPTLQTTADGVFNLMTSTGTRDIIKTSPSATADSNIRWADAGLDFTINNLRQATQVQKILERDARGGTRYTELVRSHFGVTSPDARLQRPEYLGGFSQPINISQIHQTQATSVGVTPLGQVGAIGTAMLDGNRHGFTQSFTEHCIIIGLVSVRADMTYQNRIERLWTRRSRFDHYWPALAHIGEQTITNKEIFYSGNTTTDDGIFAYQERYAEYRYKPSIVTGQFRSDAPTPLDAWHLAFDFATVPALNSTFIEEAPPLDRVIATPSEPKIIMDTWFEFQCARPMPMYGVPGLMDHF